MTRILVALAIAAAVTAGADPNAGRRVYHAGSGTASLAGSEPMPAALFPCANCHGADGRGNAEGGVVASNITWHELTKPYRAATPNGRRRPAYDEQTLRRAIAEGVDSAGNALHAAMPRYAMPPQDIADLVGYLKVIGREEVPGVTATSVRVGTIVPDSEAGAQMAAVLAAYFEEAGEIHGRRITLETIAPAQLQEDPPFALAGGLTDANVEEAIERAGIPLVLPVSVRRNTPADNHQRFYLSPSSEEQLEGLLQFTGTTRESAIVFVDPDAKLAGLPLEDTRPLLFVGSLLPSDFFREAPKYGGRIRVALTTTPADLTGLADYRAFAKRHSIPPAQIASQLSAYAAAQTLVQALKQSGRTLTRDALRASLESLYEFDTGVTPPLTFGRSRRIAAPRVHVATMDANGDLTPIGAFPSHD
ncbi:MAG TPA: ABC transporter substrate-binding protein [Thermoanaerobaculia bacterium]